jgi:hypothetical protein
MATTKRTSPKKNTSSVDGGLIRFLSEVMNRVGVVGFVVLVLTYFVFKVASPTQQQELVDKWLLLKDQEGPYAAIIVGVLILLLLVQQWDRIRVVRRMQAELDRIGDEKSRLQETLLERRLGTSTKTRKNLP